MPTDNPAGYGDATFGDNQLFKDPGHDLQIVAEQVASGTVSALRTALARQIINSQEGQAEVESVRNQQIGKFLPWIVLGVIALILFGRRLG